MREAERMWGEGAVGVGQRAASAGLIHRGGSSPTGPPHLAFLARPCSVAWDFWRISKTRTNKQMELESLLRSCWNFQSKTRRQS